MSDYNHKKYICFSKNNEREEVIAIDEELRHAPFKGEIK